MGGHSCSNRHIQDDGKLTKEPSLALNLQQLFCFEILSVGITDVSHLAGVVGCFLFVHLFVLKVGHSFLSFKVYLLWRSEDSFGDSVVRPGGKHIYPLSHFASPLFEYLFILDKVSLCAPG